MSEKNYIYSNAAFVSTSNRDCVIEFRTKAPLVDETKGNKIVGQQDIDNFFVYLSLDHLFSLKTAIDSQIEKFKTPPKKKETSKNTKNVSK